MLKFVVGSAYKRIYYAKIGKTKLFLIGWKWPGADVTPLSGVD